MNVTYHHAEYDGVHWFSAEDNGEEIAHAHVLEKEEPGRQHVEIKTLRTDPHYRRKGIGSQLIEEVTNHFPDLELRLKAYRIDEDGTQTTDDIEEFYARRGFDRYQLEDGDPWWLGDYMTKPASSWTATEPADSAAARASESAAAGMRGTLSAWATGQTLDGLGQERRTVSTSASADRRRQQGPRQGRGQGR